MISSEDLIYDKNLKNNFDYIKNLFYEREIFIIVTIDDYINMIYKSYLEFLKKYENEHIENNIFKFIKKFNQNLQYKEIKEFDLDSKI